MLWMHCFYSSSNVRKFVESSLFFSLLMSKLIFLPKHCNVKFQVFLEKEKEGIPLKMNLYVLWLHEVLLLP